jgi:hypothetical protein
MGFRSAEHAGLLVNTALSNDIMFSNAWMKIL